MRKNKLREMLRQGMPTIGTHILSTWPSIMEIIGHTGVIDYVEFEGVYSPWDLYDLENLARASELFDMSTMIKVDAEPKMFLAQRAVGSGIQNVLFTDIRSAEEARECVQIVRADTPETKGLYGCAMQRIAGFVLESGSPQFVRAMDDVVVALMIEKKEAVDNLEEILSVEGVDMVQFGRCDYSLNIGVPGQWSNSKVKEAEHKVIKVALKHNVRPKVPVSLSKPEEIQKYIDLGVRDFTIGTDVRILYEWLKKNGEDLRRILSKWFTL